jgi:hypothetical protein
MFAIPQEIILVLSWCAIAMGIVFFALLFSALTGHWLGSWLEGWW